MTTKTPNEKTTARTTHICPWWSSAFTDILVVAVVLMLDPAFRRGLAGMFGGPAALAVTCALFVVLGVLRRWADAVYVSVRRWRLDRTERRRAHVWIVVSGILLLAGYNVLFAVATGGRTVAAVAALLALAALTADDVRHRIGVKWDAFPVRLLYPAHAKACAAASDAVDHGEAPDRTDLDLLAEYHPSAHFDVSGGDRERSEEREELHQWVTSL